MLRRHALPPESHADLTLLLNRALFPLMYPLTHAILRATLGEQEWQRTSDLDETYLANIHRVRDMSPIQLNVPWASPQTVQVCSTQRTPACLRTA